MDESTLLRLLPRLNPWWDGAEVPRSLRKNDYRRREFDTLRELVGKRRVTAICGPRQVGKTTLVGQLIDALLNEDEVDPDHVLYLRTETSQLLSQSEGVISDILDTYESHFLGESFTQVEEPVYVLIDEIQKVDGWDETLKFYVDTYPELTFVVTGSVTTLIQRDASETLVGRTQRQTVVPFKFADFAESRR
jgi:predicted AAA+ superfamily ATPase